MQSLRAAATDLAKLLLLEFALVYANDWFVVPYTLPSGVIARVRGCVVDGVFGERIWVTPAGSALTAPGSAGGCAPSR